MELKQPGGDLSELDALRREQDAVDREIVDVLAKRLALRKKISAFRLANNLPTIDPGRREFVLKQAEKFASQTIVPEAMAHEVFNTLIDWSHRLDREWRNESNKQEGKSS